MADKRPVGTMFVELSLDATKYKTAQKEILAGAEKNSADIEKAFKTVGATSDKMYQAMRQNIINHLEAIKRSHLLNEDEKVVAAKAAHAKLQKMEEERYGKQVSLLDSMKKNWLAATAAITGAYMAMSKAFDLVEKSAAYAESLENLNMFTQQYSVSGKEMVDVIARNSAGLISVSVAAETATAAMAKGFTPEMLANMAKWAPILDDMSTKVNSSNEAFNVLIDSLSTGRERGVTQLLGATIDLKAAFGEQAAEMTRAEKAMAMYSLVAKRMEEIQKTGMGSTDSYADKIERFKNTLEEVKLTIGDFIARVGAGILAIFQSVAELGSVFASALLAPIYAAMKVTDYFGITKGKADEVKQSMDALAMSADDLGKKAAANFELMKKGMFAVGGTKGAPVKLGLEDAAEGESKKVKALNDKILEDVRKTALAIEQMNMDTYHKELARIDSQAKAWLAEGASEVQVAKWVAKEKEKAGAEQAERDRKLADETSKFYFAEAAKRAKEQDDLLKARVDAEFDAMEEILRGQIYYQEQMDAATGTDPTTMILKREAGEKALLELQQRRLIASITEQTTFEETLRIMAQVRAIDEQIAALKDMTTTDLIVRRIKIEQELLAIQQQQKSLAEDIAFQYQQASLNAMGLTKIAQFAGLSQSIETGKDIYRQEYDAFLELQEKKIQLLEEKGGEQVAINEAFREIDLKYEEMRNKQKIDMLSAGFGAAAEIAEQFYKAGGKQGGAAFEAYKAFSIAQAVIDTYKGAQAAYAAMAGFPLAGPALAVAAAAAAIAAGIARVNAIKNAQPGSASVSSGGGGTVIHAPTGVPRTTVLGAAAGTESESIKNVIDILGDTYDLQSQELTRIRSEMVDLNKNITGLVTSIVRGGKIGTSEGLSLGIDMGSITKWSQNITTQMANVITLGILPGLAETVGKWFGSAANAVFGGSIKKELQGAGIEFKANEVGKILANEYIDAMSYQIVKTTKDGGILSKDKTSTEVIRKSLTDDQNRLFKMVFEGMSESLVGFAERFGQDTQAAMDYVFKTYRLDLRGLTGEEMNEKLQEYFSNTLDQATEDLFGEIIGKYQKLNEGLFETASRLINDRAIMGELLEMTNQQISVSATTVTKTRQVMNEAWTAWKEQVDYIKSTVSSGPFGGQSRAIAALGPEPTKYLEEMYTVIDDGSMKVIEFTETMIEMAGGLDELVAATLKYYDKFYTAQEKLDRLTSNLKESLASVNVALPDTRAGYRDLVENLDLTTEAGQKAYVALMQLSDIADEYYNAKGDEIDATKESTAALLDFERGIRRTWEDLRMQLMELQGDTAGATAMRRERELAEANEILRPLMRAIYAQEDYNAAVSAAEDATSDYESAVEATAQAQRAAENAADRLTKAHEDAADAARELSEAQADLPRVQAEAAQRVADAEQAAVDAADDLSRAQQDLIDTQRDAAQSIIDAKEAAVDAAKDLSDAQADLVETQKDAAQSIADAQERAADAAESLADAQEEAAKSVEESAKRIADAQESLADTIESSAENIANAEEAYQDSLRGITDAQRGILDAERAYADAQQALADELRAIERRGIEARLKAEADARKAEIDRLQQEKEFADDQAQLIGEQLQAQQGMVDRLRSVSATVNDWIAGMTTSELSPVQSREAWEAEYQRLQQIASAPGAEQGDVSAFLSYAKEYLQFQRAYGGDYQTTFDAVMADVQSIGDVIDEQLVAAERQLAATQAADQAARDAAERAAVALEAAQAADEEANKTAQALLEAFDAAADDTAQRLADLRQGIADAAQGIEDAKQELVDAQNASAEAFAAIGEAQVQAQEDIADAQQALADAQAEAAQAVIDSQERIADAQEALAEAQAGIGEAQLAAQESIADAQQQIVDATEALADAQAAIGEAEIQAQQDIADAERSVADAVRDAAEAQAAIGEAQLEADQMVADAQQRIVDAQERVDQTAQEILLAEQEVADTQAALLAAQQAETMAMDRMVAAQEAVVVATNNLSAMMAAYMAAPVPVVGSGNIPGGVGLPAPAPITGGSGSYGYLGPGLGYGFAGTGEGTTITSGGYTYALNPVYPEEWGVPWGTNLPPGYNPTADANWSDLTSGGGDPAAFWAESPYTGFGADLRIPQDYSSEELRNMGYPGYGIGGLSSGPSIFGEKGREWAVPTYEPERTNFLQSAPASFWQNLGANKGGSGETITIQVPLIVDGKVLTEVVAKHIPRNAAITEAIRRV